MIYHVGQVWSSAEKNWWRHWSHVVRVAPARETLLGKPALGMLKEKGTPVPPGYLLAVIVKTAQLETRRPGSLRSCSQMLEELTIEPPTGETFAGDGRDQIAGWETSSVEGCGRRL
jgi:hypothetical protein